MSRKLLIFLLSELQVVRVICKAEGCGAVSEVGIAQAEEMFAEPYCKRCRTGFFGPMASKSNKLVALAKAIRAMQEPDVGADVEFVVPDTDSARA